MKKIFLLMLIAFMSINISAQKKTYINRAVQYNVLDETTEIDTLMVLDSNKLIKRIGYSSIKNKVFSDLNSGELRRDNSYYDFSAGTGYGALLNPTVSAVTNPFSAVLKFKTGSDVTTEQQIFSETLNSTNRLGIGINSGYFVFSTYNGSSYNSKNYPVIANTSYVFTVSKDITHIGKIIYLNGIAVATSTGFYLELGSVLGSLMCKSTISLFPFLGQIYSVQTENYEMTASEILDRYNGVPIPYKYVGADNVNKVINGTFDTDISGWTATGGWVYGTNRAEITTSTGNFYQSDIFVSGKYYRIKFDLDITAGSINLWVNGSQIIEAAISTAGAKEYFVQSTTTGSLFFEATAGTTATLDNIEVITIGNTLNLSESKEDGLWRSTAHNIEAPVTNATLHNLQDVSANYGYFNNDLKVKGSILTDGTVTANGGNSTQWNTAYNDRIISLTNTGNSGVATLGSNTLNIPTYTLNGLGGEPTFTKNTAFNKNFGTSANTLIHGNDSRLSNARIPLVHVHNHSDLTGIVANQHIDWTADQGGININAGNYNDTNTQLSNADVIASTLTGFTSYGSPSIIVAENSIFTAFRKLEYRVSVNDSKISDVNHNVTTNLSATATTTTVTINSSDGTNAVINAATIASAGLVTNTTQAFGGNKSWDGEAYFNQSVDFNDVVTMAEDLISLASIKAASYKSADGSIGITTTFVNGSGDVVTVKNGLIVQVSGGGTGGGGTADTTAPGAPIGLGSSAVTATTLVLDWSASTDNVAVTGYKIYADNILHTDVGNVLTYNLSGRTAESTALWSVKAYDAAGNLSDHSNKISITQNPI